MQTKHPQQPFQTDDIKVSQPELTVLYKLYASDPNKLQNLQQITVDFLGIR